MSKSTQVITQVIIAKEAPKRIVEIISRYVEEFSEEYKENPVFVRKSFVAKIDEKFEIEAGERAAIRWVSTIDVDRDREILMPDGCRLTEFRKAPQVLWGHNYRLPPIGRDAWVKKWPKENPKGILAKTIYAKTPAAEEIWSLVRDGFLRTSSVGFIPLKSVRNGEQGFDKLCDKIEAQGLRLSDRSKLRRIYTDWLLLEHSDVSVPANINALTVAVGKGLTLSDELLESLGIGSDDIEAAKAIESKAKYTCECLACGEKVETDKHCNEIKCPKCGGEMRRVERPGPGRSVEEEEEEKTLEEILKPYPNEHACRVADPKKYTSFARDNNKFGPGIHAIWGIKEGKSELQSIRFDKSKYPAAEARKWCKEHDYKCNPFEPAAPPKEAGGIVVRTAPEIAVIEPPKEVVVKQEPVVKEFKETVVFPIVEEEPEDIEKMVEKEVGRKLGRV